MGERGAQDLAGVVRGAADLRHVPVRAEVGGAHLRVRLEAARGEHDGARSELLARAVRVPDGHAREGAVRPAQEVLDRGAVAELDPVALRGGAVLRHQPVATVDGADREAAPEPLAPVDLVGLPLVHEPEAQALAAQPAHGIGRVAGQHARHRLVAAPERDAPEVGGEVLGAVRVEVGGREPLVRLDDVQHVLEPVVRKSDRTGGEGGVAARPRLVGLLEHEHTRPPLARGVRRAQAGVARAGHDHVPRHSPCITATAGRSNRGPPHEEPSS